MEDKLYRINQGFVVNHNTYERKRKVRAYSNDINNAQYMISIILFAKL